MWLVVGAAVLVAAWRTDRMAEQGVPWFGAPGLVPGLLGMVMMWAGLLLTLRAWRSPRAPAAAPPAWRILAVSLLLCLGFAGVVIGQGPSFGVATGLYLFLHITFLQWRERRAARQTVRGLALAAAVAIGGGLLVPLVFEKIFLVRLP